MEAIDIAKNIVQNARYNKFFDSLKGNVEAGRGFAAAFQESTFLPGTVKLMVSTGEASGALDRVMARLADRYEEDLETGIRRFSALLEPVMLVGMGLIVGVIAVSFILPIMKMSRAIH